MIDDLLELSSIESGRIKIHTEKTNVRKLTHECIRLIQPLAAARDINIQHNLDSAAAAYILVDQTRFKQVIINLLSNGIKYNKTGSLVSVDLRQNDEQVCITVSDTGPGLTKEQQKRLFLPFERIYNNTDVEGSGIGLNICKHLTELMGGHVGVNSKYRSGSQFWLEFPLYRSETVENYTREAADTETQ